MSSEPKVTECWTEEREDGSPDSELAVYHYDWTRDAILIWREDYDAMRRELEELREYKKWHEAYKLIMEKVKS